MLTVGLALPAVYFIAAILNKHDVDIHASRISQVEGSPCANFQKIDMAWALLLSTASLGAAVALLQAYVAYKGRSRKLSKLANFLSLGPFICSCMIVDIWVNIPEGCQEMLENSFDNEISLWIAIQVVVYAFIVGLSLMGCCCLMACCGICFGASLGDLMGDDDDDDIEIPEIFRNPEKFEADMNRMMAKAMRDLEQLERNAASGDRNAKTRIGYLNSSFGGRKMVV